MVWMFQPIRFFPEGGTDLLIGCRLPLRSRSPCDEDGAHQGIVSVKMFLKNVFFSAFSGVFRSVPHFIIEKYACVFHLALSFAVFYAPVVCKKPASEQVGSGRG